MEQTAGTGLLRGQTRKELHAGDPDPQRQRQLSGNPLLQTQSQLLDREARRRSGSRGFRDRGARRTLMGIEVGRLESHGLEGLHVRPQTCPQSTRYGSISLHVRASRAGARTEFERSEHRHTELDARVERILRRRLDGAALSRVAADDHRAIARARIVRSLDLGVEAGHLDEENVIPHGVGSTASAPEPNANCPAPSSAGEGSKVN